MTIVEKRMFRWMSNITRTFKNKSISIKKKLQVPNIEDKIHLGLFGHVDSKRINKRISQSYLIYVEGGKESLGSRDQKKLGYFKLNKGYDDYLYKLEEIDLCNLYKLEEIDPCN